MNKKLLFVCARLPYPASNGRKSVMYHYCKILHEIYGYDIYVVSFLEYGDYIDSKPDFIEDVFVLEPIKFGRKIYNLIKYTALQHKFPMQVSLFYSPEYKSKIADIMQNLKPDLVMTDMVRTCEYAKEFTGYKIADLDDMLSLRYERQLNVDLSSVNIYGNYVYSLPAFARSFLNIKMIKKAILNHEITLLKNMNEK